MTEKASNWTVNVHDPNGSLVSEAKQEGYNAYHANSVTAIEISGVGRAEARGIAEKFGEFRDFGEVLYVFK